MFTAGRRRSKRPSNWAMHIRRPAQGLLLHCSIIQALAYYGSWLLRVHWTQPTSRRAKPVVRMQEILGDIFLDACPCDLEESTATHIHNLRTILQLGTLCRGFRHGASQVNRNGLIIV